MSPILAHSASTAVNYIIGGSVLLFIAQIWMLVTGFQRGALWGIGIFLLFIPVGIILPIVDPRSRPPLLLLLAGFGLIVFSAVGLDRNGKEFASYQDKLKHLTEEIQNKFRPQKATRTLEERQAHVRAWQQDLQNRRATLNINDPAANAAFNKEFNEYLAELQSVKEEMAKAGH